MKQNRLRKQLMLEEEVQTTEKILKSEILEAALKPKA